MRAACEDGDVGARLPGVRPSIRIMPTRSTLAKDAREIAKTRMTASFGSCIMPQDYSDRAILPPTSMSRHKGKMVTGYGRLELMGMTPDTWCIFSWIEMDIRRQAGKPAVPSPSPLRLACPRLLARRMYALSSLSAVPTRSVITHPALPLDLLLSLSPVLIDGVCWHTNPPSTPAHRFQAHIHPF